MIVVTGANGTFGRSVAERLLTRLPAERIAASVRDPSASPLAARGVRVRHGDFDRPETLADAFAGAETVLINGTNYGTASADRARQHAAAVTAAARAGATRVVVTGWLDIEHCPLTFVQDYAETERAVRSSTMDWTILRTVYGMAASVARDVDAAVRTGVLTAPAGTARAVPASVTDLADATAAVLLEDGHAGRTYELTGPDGIDWTDLADLAAAETGKPITYRPVPEDEFREQMLAAGWPPAAVGMLLDYYAAFRSGWGGTPHRDLAEILGRPPAGSLEAVREVLAPAR